jgi:hypothetical protein
MQHCTARLVQVAKSAGHQAYTSGPSDNELIPELTGSKMPCPDLEVSELLLFCFWHQAADQISQLPAVQAATAISVKVVEHLAKAHLLLLQQVVQPSKQYATWEPCTPGKRSTWYADAS